MKICVLCAVMLSLIGAGACDDDGGNNANNINNTNNTSTINNTNSTNNLTCGDGVLDQGEECDTEVGSETCVTLGFEKGTLACRSDCRFDTSGCDNIPPVTYSLDVLFVIDDSMSMLEEQLRLRQNFANFTAILRQEMGVLPSLHVGVTSTSVGIGPFSLPTCDLPVDGRLLKGTGCANPGGQNYIVDLEPVGCEVARDDTGVCTASDCDQVNCDDAVLEEEYGVGSEPPGLTLELNDQGCPRCRNFREESLAQVFSCLADVGTEGCGFEQPFEAMHLTYTGQYAENEGFFRDNAFLAVVFVSDEDDCSARDYNLFDPEAAQYGDLGSFRCTRYGLTCDEPWDLSYTETVTMTGCHGAGADDPEALLHPISRYTASLIELKGHPALISMAAIVGPSDGSITLTRDGMGSPQLAESCNDGTSSIGAVPAVRFTDLVTGFTLPADREWALYPVCESDYTPALEGLARTAALAMLGK